MGIELLQKRLSEIKKEIERTDNNARIATNRLNALRQEENGINEIIQLIENTPIKIENTVSVLEETKMLTDKVKIITGVNKAIDILKEKEG